MGLDIDAIEKRCDAATKGPWRWYGNTRVNSVYLATVDRGRVFVMQFSRWGMASAQPMFRVDGIMRKIKELVSYEVSYRSDISQINHPDAAFIAHARQDVPALIAECRRLESENAELQAKVVKMVWALGVERLLRVKEPTTND